MSHWHDLLDWVGGYPFEVAKPEDVFRFCRTRGLELVEIATAGGGLGCNQFVFQRPAGSNRRRPASKGGTEDPRSRTLPTESARLGEIT